MKTIDNQKTFLQSLGLKTGDKVKINYTKELNQIFEIKFLQQTNEYVLEDVKTKFIGNITQLLIYDFEKVIDKNKVGNIECGDIDCTKCPFYRIECFTPTIFNKTLFDVYNCLKERYKKPFEQKILDEIILPELNKEVKK